MLCSIIELFLVFEICVQIGVFESTSIDLLILANAIASQGKPRFLADGPMGDDLVAHLFQSVDHELSLLNKFTR